jgi:hypothetical protein
VLASFDAGLFFFIAGTPREAAAGACISEQCYWWATVCVWVSELKGEEDTDGVLDRLETEERRIVYMGFRALEKF